MGRYQVGVRRACRCVRMTRSMCYYESVKDPLTALRQRTREFASAIGASIFHCDAKAGTWAKIGFIASIARKTCVCDVSGLGVTFPRRIDWRERRRLGRMRYGAWIL
jgi:hypothetical protein